MRPGHIHFLAIVSCVCLCLSFSNFCLNWTQTCFFQDLYCVRSDLGNLLKALGRLDEAKVKCACLRFSRFYGDFHSEIVWQLLPLCRQIGKSRFVYFFTTPGKLVSSPRHVFCKKRFWMKSNRPKIFDFIPFSRQSLWVLHTKKLNLNRIIQKVALHFWSRDLKKEKN